MLEQYKMPKVYTIKSVLDLFHPFEVYDYPEEAERLKKIDFSGLTEEERKCIEEEKDIKIISAKNYIYK